MFPEGNVPGYVCNPGSPRERDAASQGHTSGIPTRAMLHSWKLAPAAHHVLLSILVMTSPHLTSGRQFWLITHMIQSWITLMAFPIASRRSVSFPRGTRVTYVTWDVYQAIIQLKELKTGGLDQITAEHLKFASFRLVVLFAICFTGFMIHGLLPESMLSVTLLPVIKDKAGKVGSLDNYRPIALASVVSKVLERIILGVYLDNQFGFKAHHSTDLCIYALKEVVDLYKRKNSTVIIGFIDASKAFDRVNHQKLFSKLRQRGIPNSILRILTYWYANQSMQIKWGNCVSDSFRVSNGVRQGSLLSPALFNVYMNELSEELSDCRTGCMLGNTTVNHYMYADDLVVFFPK